MKPASRAEPAPDPIAVLVDRDGLGDVLLKLPLLRAIADRRPDHPVWWITAYESTMEKTVLPYLDGMVAAVHSRLDFHDRAISGARILSRLPAFSEVFDTRTRIANVLLARLAMRPRRYHACLPGLDKRPPHIGARALVLARKAFGTFDTAGVITASDSAYEAAARLLPPEAPWIGLAFGSNQARKNWPIERFIELARGLRSQGAAPVFLAGPAELPVLPVLAEAAPEFPAIDMTALAIAKPRGTLDTPIALARSLRVLVANDSGLGHLFGAAGVPVVSLFGPTPPERWRPVASKSRIVRAQDFGGDAIGSIPVAAALQATEALLDEIAGKTAES